MAPEAFGATAPAESGSGPIRLLTADASLSSASPGPGGAPGRRRRARARASGRTAPPRGGRGSQLARAAGVPVEDLSADASAACAGCSAPGAVLEAVPSRRSPRSPPRAQVRAPARFALMGEDPQNVGALLRGGGFRRHWGATPERRAARLRRGPGQRRLDHLPIALCLTSRGPRNGPRSGASGCALTRVAGEPLREPDALWASDLPSPRGEARAAVIGSPPADHPWRSPCGAGRLPPVSRPGPLPCSRPRAGRSPELANPLPSRSCALLPAVSESAGVSSM